MKKTFLSFTTVCSIPFTLMGTSQEVHASSAISPLHKKAEKAQLFVPFTGKVAKSKVRLRYEPSYEGAVWNELAKNDLLLILGETEDFYAVKPPEEAKGYVFRTFVLDNVVEGSRVNIRTQPHLDAPVIGQLNSGDKIEGTIDQNHNKWLEIKLPSSARLYIAKEYVENVGDAQYITRMEKRKLEVNSLLGQTQASSQAEMQKPFNQVNLEGIKANYEHIIAQYGDFPEVVTQAKEHLVNLKEAYLAKKLAFLESQSNYASKMLEAKKKQLTEELQNQKFKLASLEQQLEYEQNHKPISAAEPSVTQAIAKTSQLPVNMSIWLPVEERLYENWAEQTGKSDPHEYYEEQKEHAIILTGIIDPYTRPVKNKPGDYMLINGASKLPVAFLYSTQVNLQELIGHEVSVLVYPRPNNHYAFPAYFVLSYK
ncbi:MAG: SH3 domain-containing protein [Parachlamydia sp.]|nr:SH3 domain-containing protein [Parachlamydia sp.]